MRSGLNGVSVIVGDRVQYRVTQGMKGLQAEDISIVSRVSPIDVEGLQFAGTLKKLENKEVVFIECAETKSIFGKDVFVGKTELGKAGLSTSDAGRRVNFEVAADSDGRPRPKNICAVSCFSAIDVVGRQLFGTLKKVDNKDILCIECADAKLIFGKDVLVGKDELVNAGLLTSHVGRHVHFEIVADSGGRPCA